MVLLFLNGGADTFHMLVPRACSLYEEYRTVRKGAAFQQDQLLSISAPGQKCENFGLHPKLPFLAELYEKHKQAALVSNVGALVEPLTRAQLKAGAPHCVGMFSHSDQQAAAQTLKCQTPGNAPKGAGGRVADALTLQGYRTKSFSIAGISTWSEGRETRSEVLGLGGPVKLHHAERLRNMTKQRFGNHFVEEYARAFEEATSSSKAMAELLDGLQLKTKYLAKTPLEKQLRQVALLIAGRHARKAERDFFFVQLPGFDTHQALELRFGNLMAQLDAALSGFVAELKAQNIFESTVLATASDFGRTLTVNSGKGSDHGWGGNHIVIGGDIRGGQVFNDFPDTFAPGNAYDAGRGRVIPKYPWESFMVPIAEWLELKKPEDVFPNLGRFNRSTHIISRAQLFSS